MDNIFDYAITPIFGLLAGTSAASPAAVASYPYVSEWMSDEAVTPDDSDASLSAPRRSRRKVIAL
ncbi:MAG: hypothetical protein NC187_04555 [Candidatus Amulumruptor caecigallinarius]|nr:hypothetical protein [Candidatus Amulumruptor caecigallinarius]MCM1396742.1 hypothetical protein [Candidatus Amulumruptor caecigallinarius]MCM1453200.1 hypothetical protein [bacterium]